MGEAPGILLRQGFGGSGNEGLRLAMFNHAQPWRRMVEAPGIECDTPYLNYIYFPLVAAGPKSGSGPVLLLVLILDPMAYICFLQLYKRSAEVAPF